jgi:hypothetical protein
MKNNPHLGIISDIAEYLHSSAPVASHDLALGAAIAVMSSFAAGRYVVQPKGMQEASVVTQGVMLLGEAGTGKGLTMAAVERLFQVVGDPAIASGFTTPETLWKHATKNPGLLWVLSNANHHSLAARDPSLEGKRPQPKQSDVLLELQSNTTGLDAVFYPLPIRDTKTQRFNRQAPVTLLAETTPQAMLERLPGWMEGSPFYGELLFVGAARHQRTRHAALSEDPSPALIAKLRELSGQRNSPEAVMVQLDEEAAKVYRALLGYCRFDVPAHEPDAVALLAERVLRVAALYAIGNDHRQPVVTKQLIAEALELVKWSREYARMGLQGSHARRFTELVADEFPTTH